MGEKVTKWQNGAPIVASPHPPCLCSFMFILSSRSIFAGYRGVSDAAVSLQALWTWWWASSTNKRCSCMFTRILVHTRAQLMSHCDAHWKARLCQDQQRRHTRGTVGALGGAGEVRCCRSRGHRGSLVVSFVSLVEGIKKRRCKVGVATILIRKAA